ncbi:MAG TPA: RMD1 family protein [Synechococcales cyanobacterium M55_K2018_004]|nr:RMD1 family protein [Synechococcales cyanobacterium M55_K2018_004]
MQKQLFAGKDIVKVRALFLGERLDLKALETTETLAKQPLVVAAGECGCAVLFKYGAVVLFGLGPVEEASFLTYLKPLVIEPFDSPETEDATLKLDPAGAWQAENGLVRLQDFSIESVQIVADVLAKSVVLAQYEKGTAGVFDQIEPFAEGLQRTTKNERWGKELLRQLGTTLTIRHKIVGRVEIIDKPELLWDAPMLERLYLRLENEYEIRERHQTLERKLYLISSTAETVLDLLQHNSTLRVEWYVVILIVVEILLSFYSIVFHT